MQPTKPIDVAGLTSPELLALHAAIAKELRIRGVTRSANNPTADLAEYLCCKAFDWKQESKSNRGFDATGPDGVRYEIKGRRITRENKSRELSAIRNLDENHFDVLAGVIFNEDYSVFRAALIPWSIVKGRAPFVKHTNSHRFLLRDEVWNDAGVKDVTKSLRAVAF